MNGSARVQDIDLWSEWGFFGWPNCSGEVVSDPVVHPRISPTDPLSKSKGLVLLQDGGVLLLGPALHA